MNDSSSQTAVRSSYEERLLRQIYALFFQVKFKTKTLPDWLPVNAVMALLREYPEWCKMYGKRRLNAWTVCQILRERYRLEPTQKICADGKKRSGYARHSLKFAIARLNGRPNAKPTASTTEVRS